MSAHDKRKARRAREAVKAARDAAALIASIRADLVARDRRIERLEEDVVEALRTRDKATLTLRNAVSSVNVLTAERSKALAELADAHAGIAKLEADLELADEDIRAWRERAQQWEALGKEAQKLRNRLDAKAQAAREAPANRKAATPYGGQQR